MSMVVKAFRRLVEPYRSRFSLRFVAGIACVSLVSASASAEDMKSITLRNGNMEMSVINYGARIQSLKFAGQDMVLGFDTLDNYASIKQNFGAVVGRYIGRIIGGKLPLPTSPKGRSKKTSEVYQLQVGPNGDCAHGGTPGFSQQYWKFVPVHNSQFTVHSYRSAEDTYRSEAYRNDSTIVLRYVSPDGENGFPGELTLDVTYTLLHDALRIDYTATTTKPTVLNPSNHSFFNLTADLSESIHDELLWINSDSICLYNDKKQVTGKMMSVTGSPFDFRHPTPIGQRINEDNKQLKITGGYDHCYALPVHSAQCTVHSYRNDSTWAVTPVARLSDLSTGISMEVYTTEPAMQIYTANGHKGNIIGKDGKTYPKQNAICFETMHFPDSPNNPQWPSTQLNPGEKFHSTTIYKFSITCEE